jgi:hypothetical protein
MVLHYSKINHDQRRWVFRFMERNDNPLRDDFILPGSELEKF